MVAEKIAPSWLTSWVAWRNYYTKPGSEKPYHVLKEQLGIKDMPSKSFFLSKNNNYCPHCGGEVTVDDKKYEYGEVYCICETLSIIEEVNHRNSFLRTSANKSYLSTIKYPIGYMGPKYKESMEGVVNTAKRFIAKPNKWLYIEGYFGTGKTHVLKAINTAFYPMALYISARDLEQKAHEFRKLDMLDVFYKNMAKAPILILDDIGMEFGGKLVSSMIDKVIDDRYEDWTDKPVVVATNIPTDKMKGYVPRAFDRLMDKEKVTKLTIITKDSYRDIAVGKR